MAKELGRDDWRCPITSASTRSGDFNQEAFVSGFLGPRFARWGQASRQFRRLCAVAQQSDGLRGARRRTISSCRQRHAPKRLARCEQPSPAKPDARTRPRRTGPVHHATLTNAPSADDRSDSGAAFDLDEESAEVRGRSTASVLRPGLPAGPAADRAGVPFVEVSLGAKSAGWDTHDNNFNQVQAALGRSSTPAGRTLMKELDERGPARVDHDPLDGRIRPHAADQPAPPAATTSPTPGRAVLAGGGIAGGQAYGRTSRDGIKVEEGKIGVGATCRQRVAALGIDPKRQNMSDIGRPFRIAEGQPIQPVLS